MGWAAQVSQTQRAQPNEPRQRRVSQTQSLKLFESLKKANNV